MNIAIAGIGYVGLSNGILLSQNNSVILLDVDQSKVDLINKKHLEKINLNSTYQFYNLENINSDIELALNKNLDILNLATEPVKLKEVVKLCFDYKIKGNFKSTLRQENMVTKFAKKLNKKSKYLYLKNEIIDDIKSFIDNN